MVKMDPSKIKWFAGLLANDEICDWMTKGIAQGYLDLLEKHTANCQTYDKMIADLQSNIAEMGRELKFARADRDRFEEQIAEMELKAQAAPRAIDHTKFTCDMKRTIGKLESETTYQDALTTFQIKILKSIMGTANADVYRVKND